MNYGDRMTTQLPDQSPYAVPLADLEAAVHVPVEDLIEGQSEPALPHDLADENVALGAPLRPKR
ncbi:MAG: hypothetical protein QOG49_1138 [Frankiaceae bacterium]|jgi:hypothetical protein|nr:hypothetical protein [Frankiaceae bacterium]